MTEDEYRDAWDPRQRFRPYALRPGGEFVWLAAAGCEHLRGIDTMVGTLTADGEIGEDDVVMVLDTDRWQDGKPGRWMMRADGEVRYRATTPEERR